jgi:hypothetical protein
MNSRIIYPTDDGGVNIIVPAPEWLAQEGNTMEVFAQMRVPEGKPYKILDIADFPLELDAQGNPVLDELGVVKHDRTFRDAWEYTA